MFCKNCGKELSDDVKFCPQCGFRVEEEAKPEEVKTEEVNSEEAKPEEVKAEEVKPEEAKAEEAKAEEVKPEEAKAEDVKPEEAKAEEVKPEEAKAEEAKAEEAKAEEAKAEEAKPVEEAKVEVKVEEAKPKKKKSLKLTLGIVGAVVIVLLVTIVANASVLTNFFTRSFSSPEKYYQWVEGKTSKDTTKLLGSLYTDYILGGLGVYDTSVNGQVSVKLEEAGQDMMSLFGLAGVDMSWFKDATLGYSGSIKNKAIQGEIDLSLGKNQIFSVDSILDLSDDLAVFLAFPDLSKSYLSVEGDDNIGRGYSAYAVSGAMTYAQSMEMLEAIEKGCPSEEEFEKIVNKYLDVVIANIDDVKLKNGKSLRANGITEKCTELSYEVDAIKLKTISKALIEEMKEDKDLEKVITKMYDNLATIENMGVTGDSEEMYQMFLQYLDMLDQSLSYQYTDNTVYEIKVYVDNKGNIAGRSIEVKNEWDSYEVEYIMPHKGSNYGFKASMVMDGDEISITGSGKDSSSRLNGEFEVKYNGISFCEIKVNKMDMSAIKKGYLNGEFTLSPSAGLLRMMDMTYMESTLSDVQLQITSTMKKNSSKLELDLNKGEDKLGTIAISANKGNGKKISIPTKNVIYLDGYEAIEDYWDTIKWDSFFKKLNKTDLPSEWVEYLEDLSEIDLEDLLYGFSY